MSRFLREHLIERKAVSGLCEQHIIHSGVVLSVAEAIFEKRNSVEKARSVCLSVRPRSFRTHIGGWRRRSPQGGIPLVIEGKMARTIVVSCGTLRQDGQCAEAGADALK